MKKSCAEKIEAEEAANEIISKAEAEISKREIGQRLRQGPRLSLV